MLDPDLGYYFRVLRSRWSYILVGGLLGVLAGFVLTVVRPNPSIRIEQRVVADDSTAIEGEEGLVYLQLPKRDMTEEAAIVANIADELGQEDHITAVADEDAGSLAITATGGSENEAQRALEAVYSAYVQNRNNDYASRIATARASLDSAIKSADLAAQDLDDQIASLADSETVAAQAIVTLRSDVARSQRELAGEHDMIVWVDSVQSGGVKPAGESTRSTSGRLSSNGGILITMAVVGMALGALIALMRRNSKKNFDTPADLALLHDVVVLGGIDDIDTRTLEKLAKETPSENGSRMLRVTESFVGMKADDLRSVLARNGLDARVETVVSLAGSASARTGSIVIAVDRSVDNERTISDVIRMLKRDPSDPLLAVLC